MYRARQKVIPWEKFDISGIVVFFFAKFAAFIYRGGFRPHIMQTSLQYLVAFKNYNYLNLNVYFSK